ncbi:YbjN domain-containing protein [Pseudofrankia sp. DC12]|uniref:YbjN domain-containing protein n=1 Tax=Pseudofrankia sp. DC12 TaxID=683315 RepID=UPI000A509C7F|nr:YbjN domain-containing protein [Pseudofrankia sp. DC12]
MTTTTTDVDGVVPGARTGVTGRIGDADRERLDGIIQRALDELELAYEHPALGTFLVTLEGEHKLRTMTWLVVQDHTLLVEAFFMRKPAENAAGTYAFLLSRNAKTYGVHFSIDRIGDIFLTGQVPLTAVNADEIDRLLGCARTYADENFDPAIALGFAQAVAREKAWRAKVAAEARAARAQE